MSSPFIRCDECGSSVELTRVNRCLTLTCDCPKQRSVKVARAVPEEWQG